MAALTKDLSFVPSTNAFTPVAGIQCPLLKAMGTCAHTQTHAHTQAHKHIKTHMCAHTHIHTQFLFSFHLKNKF